jgi:hypothetical protein
MAVKQSEERADCGELKSNLICEKGNATRRKDWDWGGEGVVFNIEKSL